MTLPFWMPSMDRVAKERRVDDESRDDERRDDERRDDDRRDDDRRERSRRLPNCMLTGSALMLLDERVETSLPRA